MFDFLSTSYISIAFAILVFLGMCFVGFYSNLKKYKRQNAIAGACASIYKKKITVLLYSHKKPYKTASLINLLFRQSNNPNNINIILLEEIDHEQQDTLYFYQKHYNTVNNHKHQVHVSTRSSLHRKRKKTEALLELWKIVRKTETDFVLCLSTDVIFICNRWEEKLQQILRNEPTNTVITTVPVRPSTSLQTAESVFRSNNFVYGLDKPLSGVVSYPYIGQNGRFQTAPFFKSFASTKTGCQSPLVHPEFAFTTKQLFDIVSKQMISIPTHNKLVRHVGNDLALTVYFGNMARFSVAPINICASYFTSSPPPSKRRHKNSHWQQFVLKRFNIDMVRGIVAPEMQLGIWPPATSWGSNAERILGIIRRHGSLADYRHKLQKKKALRNKK